MSSCDEKLFLLEENNRALADQVMEASIVSNITELLNSANSDSELLTTLLYSLHEMDLFKRIVFLKVDKKTLKLIPTASEGIDESDLSTLSFPLTFMGGDFADAVFTNSQFVMENGIEDGDEFSIKMNCDRYMVTPLSSRSVYPNIPKDIAPQIKTEDDRRKFLVTQPDFPVAGLFVFDLSSLDDARYAQEISIVNQLINTAGVIHENLSLMSQLKLYHDKIEQELEQAKKVQLGLLPNSLPSNDKINAACRYIPMEKVSGDYYDLFPLGDECYGIIIADVSGHGASSALVMAMAKMLLLTNASKTKTPSETLDRVNDDLVTLVNTNKFITTFYAVLDIKKSQLHYTSAGHCPVFLIDKESRELTSLESDGFFVGMFPELGLQNHTINFEGKNKRLILFTDGITEAMKSDNEQYGDDRFAKSALRQLNFPPQKATEMMLSDHRRFLNNSAYGDDITLLIIDF
jgi:serine phosphatase RsbU (regulator of sigma subunit)